MSFSSRINSWITSSKRKTLADLIKVFSEKSFAVSLLVLMIIPALPLPTGGITHLFEIVAMLLALEMILGLKTIWLPKPWQKLDITKIVDSKASASFISKLKWLEGFSKPRLKALIAHTLFLRLTGLFMLIFCLSAFLAPPFTGLDTLPSLGVVFIALAIILEDIIFYIAGMILGVIGIGTTLLLGTAIFKTVSLWF